MTIIKLKKGEGRTISSGGLWIFDNEIDNWDMKTSVFDHRIFNRKRIILIASDSNGNVFGGFLNSPIIKENMSIEDKNAFIFSLKSNGRLKTPQKFSYI